jgi:hypothetical protein
MRARYWMALGLLLSLQSVHAEEAKESDPPLELIEMLGETDQVESDLEIAMSEVKIEVNKQETHPEEVKDDK